MEWVEVFDGEAECPECLVVVCAFCQGDLGVNHGCRGTHKSHCSYQPNPRLQREGEDE